MTRDHHVAGVAPDWTRRAQQFNPLVHSDVRPRPMAVRRRVPLREVETLKARWFAIGAIAAILPFGVAVVAIRFFGG